MSVVTAQSTSSRAPGVELNVGAMLTAQALGHDLEDPKIVETHISWVLLTGEFAYKIRRPVVMPFLDFRFFDFSKHGAFLECPGYRFVDIHGTPFGTI